ncbi:MAG TPA: L,D-transpeptidase/peptidoglycan binding protein [Solirubrobacteraceae bacterium]|jgi:lipoprotein-anchoring transpeptidase ErfK/SrfK|nr:L,D-transpeptidase/peptidoglycan binding protein [Solirubrobacteraceae bacterium]
MSASPLSWRSTPAIRHIGLRWWLLGGAGLLAALALALYLFDHSQRGTIAKGVHIDGVPVGGLGEAAAIAKVQHALTVRLERPVVVRAGGRSWRLGAREAALALDARAMVTQALSASREGSIFSRTARELFGGSLHRDVPLAFSYSHATVRGLAARVTAAIDRPPRDATVQASATGLAEVPAQDGLRVNYPRLKGSISSAVGGDGSSRIVAVTVAHTKPKIGIGQLAAQYPAYIVIDRADFRLRLYQHLKLTSTYEIAVGMEGLETPAGLHHIEWKQENPPWYVPNKAWAGALAGTVVPPGPADPLKARFMSFDGGAGIHGIDPSEYETIGHDASHGCVRMRIPDVISLYSRTPLGTPVYIA